MEYININKEQQPIKESQYFWFIIIQSLIGLLFFNTITSSNIHKFFSRLQFHLKLQLISNFQDSDHELSDSDQQSYLDNKKGDHDGDDKSLNRQEVETVMGDLGLVCSSESEKLNDSISFNEFSKLFHDKEPSLEEIKEAFDVFDVNKDGFIDAEELQRVLCILGLKEGKNAQNCRNMIRAFDDNKDGKIGFNEFLKFMENTLY